MAFVEDYGLGRSFKEIRQDVFLRPTSQLRLSRSKPFGSENRTHPGNIMLLAHTNPSDTALLSNKPPHYL